MPLERAFVGALREIQSVTPSRSYGAMRATSERLPEAGGSWADVGASWARLGRDVVWEVCGMYAGMCARQFDLRGSTAERREQSALPERAELAAAHANAHDGGG